METGTGIRVLSYHSRFKLRDRRDRHDDVVAAFKRPDGQGGSAVLGITTQVCELSLDLDCDLKNTCTSCFLYKHCTRRRFGFAR
jgi:CRISPR-associated endonuclease/helicase Cas3